MDIKHDQIKMEVCGEIFKPAIVKMLHKYCGDIQKEPYECWRETEVYLSDDKLRILKFYIESTYTEEGNCFRTPFLFLEIVDITELHGIIFLNWIEEKEQ